MNVSKTTETTERGWEQFNTKLRPSLFARLKKCAERSGVTLQDIATEALEAWLKRKEKRSA